MSRSVTDDYVCDLVFLEPESAEEGRAVRAAHLRGGGRGRLFNVCEDKGYCKTYVDSHVNSCVNSC